MQIRQRRRHYRRSLPLPLKIIANQTEDSLDYRFIKEICDKHGAHCTENEPLAPYTSFKIGGPCPIMAKPNGAGCLSELIKALNSKKAPFRVMGRGSNLLISDKGTDVPVILISSDMGGISFDGEQIVCGAGTALTAVCNAALDRSLTGMEFAYGIPGSAGGALYMNAGAYGGEMKDVVQSCTYIDEVGDLHTLPASRMDLSYRHSFFSGKPFIITEITLSLRQGDKEQIQAKMHDLMQKRRDKQPLDYPSAGSTFKRPEGDFAGRLIEAAGLRGFTVGGAAVSEKHCGFVINKGNATFGDVKNLIDIIKQKVKETSGKDLSCEVIIWE